MWFKDAIIYSLDVETFMDGNGDGVGDFRGLIERIDHFAVLGVTCIWLQPFFPSPNRDDGYDIMDYYDVDPRFGTLGDFAEFVHQLDQRGLRLILDLVVNHTSDQHPWFKEACRHPASPYRDFYVWADEKPEDADTGMVFPGEQHSTWSWNEDAGAWYFHRFYPHQPDLNTANPAVREEIMRIMGFWLRLGVAGFRVDAAPFLIEHAAVEKEQAGEQFEFLEEMRSFCSWRSQSAVLLAEANVTEKQAHDYFGEGRRMHVLFNFLVNQPMFLAFARQEAAPLVTALRKLPDPGRDGTWANFLRTHDELDLGRLSKKDRQEVYDSFGPDPCMQIYDRGIRRRLASMFEGNPQRLAMAHSLMMTLPGLQVLRYGDEIGMGDDLSLDGRNPVRTPMQWADVENAGFSAAPPERLIRPVVSKGRFGYGKVNVREQLHDGSSLLNIVSHLVRMRRACPEIGLGDYEIVDCDDPAVLGLCFRHQGRRLIVLHNLSARKCRACVSDDRLNGYRAVSLVGTSVHREWKGRIEMPAYGYRWLRLQER